MNTAFYIAREEWRYWLRSKVAVTAFIVVSIIVAAVSFINSLALLEEAHQRSHQQATAEQTFLDQPDRHPHRMVHYGHYAFRTPPPLAIFDTGVDSVTGQSIFLEGHRQNSATFASSSASADVGSFQSITPAFVYQVLIPLLLITIGSGVLVREREAKTLIPLMAQGVAGTTIYFGKVLALMGLSLVMLLPLIVLISIGMVSGETWSVAITLILSYFIYLLIWCALIVLVSAKSQHYGIALGTLICIWLFWSLVIPRFAVTSASAAIVVPGKIEVDYKMYADLRELGDGHNAADPAFAKLRRDLLAEYQVDSVEDLPINFRGMVAQTSESELTEVMNRYANERMQSEQAQSQRVSLYGWLSPVLAIATASKKLAGTDLETHHRFLKETEKLRFDFVQGLNVSHVQSLDYKDDINRNQSAEASRRARISSENWQVLDNFNFAPSSAEQRLAKSQASLLMLLAWLIVLFFAGIMVSRRLNA